MAGDRIYRTYHETVNGYRHTYIIVGDNVWDLLKKYSSKATAIKGAEYQNWLTRSMYHTGGRYTKLKAFHTDEGWGVYQLVPDKKYRRSVAYVKGL